MTEAADPERRVKRSWAAPGGLHDVVVKLLKVLLPAGVGVLLAYLLLSPLSKNREISFLLDKNKVDVAGERLKVQSAQYRGQDNQGRPFTINADKALQATSSEPVVDIDGMAASIQLADGPARIQAPKGRYDMDAQKVDVLGPILITAADGYRLETSDVLVDLNTHRLGSSKGVEGQMPLGRFTAQEMTADLPSRKVVLSGRARLHIEQGALR
ncbi:LPS export ABC transporter periplasmic protein LptC [Sphingomonas parva]|uniref:LPS export ABC transporter periplasmic protein LptC n=1 Tax=Sphingomonas parva TaxID=2555898 RepID=A0A4Y8ZW51_9SPHN|nr:LPS export ABC transporter periplasmic protein LptC [Sphingomonas parva]TFI58929.1 LPS export ABC transporter periplasmic protein LptC [Sphingomonas parva]